MTISIIIPTYNRAEALQRSLNEIFRADFSPADFEILVVDNGSTDNTAQVVERVAKSEPRFNLRYMFEPHPGLLAARHRGAHECQSDICAYIDDDSHIAPGWLHAIRDVFKDPAVVLLGGPSKPLYLGPQPDWLGEFISDDGEGKRCGWLSLFDSGGQARAVNPRYIWGLNYIIRKETLWNLGGFNPDTVPQPLQRYQGDGESGLNIKILDAKLNAFYHPDVMVHHEITPDRLSVKYFEKRSFFQGVCDSFTDIRRRGCTRLDIQHWKKPLRPFVRWTRNQMIHRFSGSRFGELHRHLSRLSQVGYDFHQREVVKDPALLKWVMKADYQDYRLPTGWEEYASPSSTTAKV